MSAKVTVKEQPDSRMVTTKNGPKQVHFQRVEVETAQARFQHEMEIDGPAFAFPVGTKKEWDIEADIVPGRYGPELARRMTLRDAATK